MRTLSEEEIRMLEELNEITINSLMSSENAKINDPSDNGKKGGSVKSEKKRLSNIENGRNGREQFKDSEFQRRMGLRGGKKGGDKAKDMKVGIHSLTKEQLSENSKKSQSVVRECPHCGYIGKGSTIFISHMDKCFMIGKDKQSFDTELLKYGGITKLSNLYNISYWTLSSYKQHLTNNNG